MGSSILLTVKKTELPAGQVDCIWCCCVCTDNASDCAMACQLHIHTHLRYRLLVCTNLIPCSDLVNSVMH